MFEYLDRMKQWAAARGFLNSMSDDEYEKAILEFVDEFEIPFNDSDKEMLHALIYSPYEQTESMLFSMLSWKMLETCMAHGWPIAKLIEDPNFTIGLDYNKAETKESL